MNGWNSRIVVIAVAGSLALGAQSYGQSLPRVALVSAASGSSTTASNVNLEVQANLLSTGMFSEVAIFNANTTHGSTPTLAEIQPYDAVLTWSNGTYDDSVLLGDILADYVDGGGGVVVAVFANAVPTTGRFLDGRWLTGDYEIVRSGSGSTSGSASMGTIIVPGHPIMDGVHTFSGTFRPTGTALSPHGQLIAEWDDGRVLVAVSSQFPNRVDLGMYPRSSGWVAGTDAVRLMANALLFSMGPGDPPCYANCDGSTTEPILTVDDFTCFINEFAQAQTLPPAQQIEHYANCDGSTTEPILTVDDFTCFINAFAQGCP